MRILLCFFLSLLTAGQNIAASEQIQCEDLFHGTLYNNAKKYYQEVKSTKGLALVFREPQQAPEFVLPFMVASNERDGFITRTLQFLPNRISKRLYGTSLDFKPFTTLSYYLIQIPTRAITRKLFNRTKEISTLVLLLGSMSLTNLAYEHYSLKLDQLQLQHFEEKIEEHGKEYDILLRSDFRFLTLQTFLNDKALSPAQLHQISYQWQEMQRKYFNYIDQHYSKIHAVNPKQANAELLEDMSFGKIYFSDLDRLYRDGIPQEVPDFKYDENTLKRLDDAALDTLIKRRIFMHTKMEMIYAMFVGGEHLKQVKQTPILLSFIQKIERDPFTHRLQELVNQKIISDEKMMNLLQEDMFWQNRFSEWKLVGLTKLNPNFDKSLGRAMTLEDIRQETLDEILIPQK